MFRQVSPFANVSFDPLGFVRKRCLPAHVFPMIGSWSCVTDLSWRRELVSCVCVVGGPTGSCGFSWGKTGRTHVCVSAGLSSHSVVHTYRIEWQCADTGYVFVFCFFTFSDRFWDRRRQARKNLATVISKQKRCSLSGWIKVQVSSDGRT